MIQIKNSKGKTLISFDFITGYIPDNPHLLFAQITKLKIDPLLNGEKVYYDEEDKGHIYVEDFDKQFKKIKLIKVVYEEDMDDILLFIGRFTTHMKEIVDSFDLNKIVKNSQSTKFISKESQKTR